MSVKIKAQRFAHNLTKIGKKGNIMKLSAASIALTSSIFTASSVKNAAAQAEFGELPPGLSTDGAEPAWAAFVEGAFPTWCIDENENRLPDLVTCADGSTNGRYDPLYLTKWHGGEDPALGGYPTDGKHTRNV